jgi:8-oxo-dGTP pyrophosphatase MutT (NUDIX family)
MAAISVIKIDRLELTFAPQPWPFAEERHAEIMAHFAERQRNNPTMWNGRVLMLHRHAIDRPVFRGAFTDVDYAGFIAWQDWGRPETGLGDCFAQGAVRSADGAFLLGVMSQHTAHPGWIYFPSGIPDKSDIVGDTVDLEASIWRELREETGLTPADVTAEPGWHTVLNGSQFAHIKILQARENAAVLRARILDVLASQRHPELSDIRIVRSPADFAPMMPEHVTAFITDAWRG